MKQFDRMLKELSRKVEIPKEYNQRIDEILNSLPEKTISPKAGKRKVYRKWVAIAFSLIFLVCLLKLNPNEASANIFEQFQLTIMNILNMSQKEDPEAAGVGSRKDQTDSKPDLLLELQETVIDKHSIYLLVKIIAPTDIAFTDDIAFDYFGFCEGENYNTKNLIGGVRDCYLLETRKDKPNVATYVVCITSDEELKEDSMVTMFAKDLTRAPFSDEPELLVEGIWSISFSVAPTVRENITVEGTTDMTFPFLNTTASLDHIELTPLELTVVSDVSKFPYDDLGISDTTIAVTLKMLDGSEQLVMTHNLDDPLIIETGSRECSRTDGKTYLKDTYSFREIVDINKVAGIYIEDLYIPAQ